MGVEDETRENREAEPGGRTDGERQSGANVGAQAVDRQAVLTTLLEHTSDFILVCDGEGRPIAFNRAYARTIEAALGITMEPGLQPHKLLPDPKKVAWWDEQHRRVLSGECFRVEYTQEFPQAGACTFECTYTPVIVDGEVIGFSEISRDVTERARVEEALKRREVRHRSLLESAADVVYAIDASGRYLYVNDRFAESMDLPADEIIGRHLDELFPPEIAKRFWSNVSAVLSSGKRRMFPPERVPTRKGDSVVSSTISPVEDADGRVWAVVGVSTDITELNRAQDERRQLETQLMRAQKLESLFVLAEGIAHDFNNILVGVLGNADLLLRDLSADGPHRPRVEAIETAARAASDLARQLLIYSGRGQARISRLNLNAVVRETTGLLEVAVGKATRIAYDLDDAIPEIDADPTQLRQMILNLVMNAAEAIGSDAGCIRVETSIADGATSTGASELTFGSCPVGPCVSLLVSDTGCGMSEEVIAKIFDPFFSTKFTGRGLGLAAVAGFVRSHNGTISVQSEPGKGATFRVLLPAATGVAAETVAAAAPSAGRALAGKRLLFVDDEPVVRRVGDEMARFLGMEVTLAEDGRRAVRALADDPDGFDVVLLDLTMPGMSGLEALERLRRIRSEIPVVLTSGLGAQAVAEQTATATRTLFLDKPYRLEDLEGVLLSALGALARD